MRPAIMTIVKLQLVSSSKLAPQAGIAHTQNEAEDSLPLPPHRAVISGYRYVCDDANVCKPNELQACPLCSSCLSGN